MLGVPRNSDFDCIQLHPSFWPITYIPIPSLFPVCKHSQEIKLIINAKPEDFLLLTDLISCYVHLTASMDGLLSWELFSVYSVIFSKESNHYILCKLNIAWSLPFFAWSILSVNCKVMCVAIWLLPPVHKFKILERFWFHTFQHRAERRLSVRSPGKARKL